MYKMYKDVRVCFEAATDMNISSSEVFLKYSKKVFNILREDFDDCRFAGYIILDACKLNENKMEPSWQFIIPKLSAADLRRLKNWAQWNPLKNYHMHVISK